MNVRRVCAVVVTYNGSAWIEECLRSLLGGESDVSVIVIDNNSSDETRDLVSDNFKEAYLIELDSNVGFGVANNIGISRAIDLGFEYVFLLNQDAYVTNSTLVELTNFLDLNLDFDAVTPLHCSPNLDFVDRKTLRSYLLPYAPDYLSDACLGTVKLHYTIFGINAAAWFVRTKTFLVSGGFDPLFFMYGEDDDLLARFKDHGIRFALLPHSKMVHLRKSPSQAEGSFWVSIERIAAKSRSNLVRALKNPSFSVAHMLLQIVKGGFMGPLSDFLVERNLVALFGNWLACVKVACEIRRIRKHARICAQEGPSFLVLSDKLR